MSKATLLQVVIAALLAGNLLVTLSRPSTAQSPFETDKFSAVRPSKRNSDQARSSYSYQVREVASTTEMAKYLNGAGAAGFRLHTLTRDPGTHGAGNWVVVMEK